MRIRRCPVNSGHLRWSGLVSRRALVARGPAGCCTSVPYYVSTCWTALCGHRTFLWYGAAALGCRRDHPSGEGRDRVGDRGCSLCYSALLLSSWCWSARRRRLIKWTRPSRLRRMTGPASWSHTLNIAARLSRQPTRHRQRDGCTPEIRASRSWRCTDGRRWCGSRWWRSRSVLARCSPTWFDVDEPRPVARVERRLLSESRVAAFGLGSVHGSALDRGLTQHGVIQTIPKLTVARARHVPDRAATGGKSQRTTGRWSRTLRKHEGPGFRGLNVFVAGVGFEPT
jgi:hypothetical protein